MDEKIKTWTLRLPAKENPDTEKALFDWPIVLQYDVKAKYRLISRKFSGMLCPFEKPIESLYFRLFLFLSCSRVFISRPYENRPNASLNLCRGERAFLGPVFVEVGGPQVGEVTRFGGITRPSSVHIIFHFNLIMIAGVTHRMLPHLSGVPHRRVNRP